MFGTILLVSLLCEESQEQCDFIFLFFLFRCQLWTLWILLWEPEGTGQSRSSTFTTVWCDRVVCKWFAYRDAECLDTQPSTEGSRDAAKLCTRSPLCPKESMKATGTILWFFTTLPSHCNLWCLAVKVWKACFLISIKMAVIFCRGAVLLSHHPVTLTLQLLFLKSPLWPNGHLSLCLKREQ